MQLQVSVDSNGVPVPNRSVDLSVTAIDLKGAGADGPYGHVHTGGAPKPAGSLSTRAFNTGSTGVTTVTYTTGTVSGPVVIKAKSEKAREDDDTIHVGVRGLIELPPRPSYRLFGFELTPWHPQNHWATPVMLGKVSALADAFFATYDRTIWYNDMSLPQGGRFDLKQDWDQPHKTHRAGRDLDVRTNGNQDIGGLTSRQRNWVWDRWERLGGTIFDERWVRRQSDGVLVPNTASPHYHLNYRRGF
jgi:hypothetical protein